MGNDIVQVTSLKLGNLKPFKYILIYLLTTLFEVYDFQIDYN